MWPSPAGRVDDRRVVQANLARVDRLARGRKLLFEYAACGKGDSGEDGLDSVHALLRLELYLRGGGLRFVRGSLLLLPTHGPRALVERVYLTDRSRVRQPRTDL